MGSGKIRSAYTFSSAFIKKQMGLSNSRIPICIMWITEKCNLSCQMCDQWLEKNQKNNEMSSSQVLKFIDDAALLGTRHFVITGGEPFLRKDIFDILKHFKKRRLSFHICSNAFLLDEEKIHRLKNYAPNSISISLDSDTPDIHNKLRGTNCHKSTIKAIKLAKKYIPKTKIGINFLINKINFRRLNNMIPFCQALKIDKLNIMPLHTNLHQRTKPLNSFDNLMLNNDEVKELNKEIDIFMKRITKTNIQTLSKTFMKGIPKAFNRKFQNSHSCHAGHMTYSLYSDGGVAVCENLDTIGNVKEKSLRQIFNSPQYRNSIKQVRKCHECWDSTHSELNILFSAKGIVNELPSILYNSKYYL